MSKLVVFALLSEAIWVAGAAVEGQPPSATQYFQRKQLALNLLQEGKARESVKLAEELNRQMPDDLDVYGLLVDGYRKTGDSAKALRAAQWMLDIRPTDPRSLSRAAVLREDAGDLDGAIDLWNECFRQTQSGDPAAQAGALAALAKLFVQQNKIADARQLAQEALRLEPTNRTAKGILIGLDRQ